MGVKRGGRKSDGREGRRGRGREKERLGEEGERVREREIGEIGGIGRKSEREIDLELLKNSECALNR